MEGNLNNQGYPYFILGIENGMAMMTLKAANGILGNKENFYRLVQEEGFFLPALSSRAVTNDYLRGVLSGKVYQFRTDQIRTPPKPKKEWSKIEMLTFIQSRLGQERELGFGPNNIPDNEFLLAVCFTLDPNLEIFTGIKEAEEIVQIPVNFLERIKFFDPNLRNVRSNVIQKSTAQKQREKRLCLEKRRNRKMRRTNLIEREAGRLQSEVDALNDMLINEMN
jgi:hypothetical protein